MTTDEMKEQNFGLTKAEFLNLVAELKNGNEQIFEKIFLSQFHKTVHYVMIKHKTAKEVAYDMCMDAMINFRKLILEEKIHYGNLKVLFTRMSSQKYIKHHTRISKFQFGESLPETQEKSKRFSKEELSLLGKAWNKLGEECQFILKHFYYNNLKSYEIAEMLNKSAGALRKQKERCIHTLRINFQHIN